MAPPIAATALAIIEVLDLLASPFSPHQANLGRRRPGKRS